MSPYTIRNVPPVIRTRIAAAAAARGMALADYLAALVTLHDAARARADAGDVGLAAELQALGLQTVQS